MISTAEAYQPTDFDFVMLEILEEQVERKVKSNYERFQLEKYGNILEAGDEELENGLANAEHADRYTERMSELQLMENDTSDIPD